MLILSRAVRMQRLNNQSFFCLNILLKVNSNFIINKYQFNSFSQYTTISNAIHTNSAQLQSSFLISQDKSYMLFLISIQKSSVGNFAMPKPDTQNAILLVNHTCVWNTIEQLKTSYSKPLQNQLALTMADFFLPFIYFTWEWTDTTLC